MVVVGLLDIPPEIQLQIAEFVEANHALKALSVTSRSLRSIAQSVLFKSFLIDLEKELKGSIDDLLANPQICAAIRFFELRGRRPWNADTPHSDEAKLSLIKELLPKMVGLRAVHVEVIQLSRVFMDAFLEMAAKIPLEVTLDIITYPSGICIKPNTLLRISDLYLISNVANPSIDVFHLMLCASAATLTKLSMVISGDELRKFAGIDLPFLHDLTLSITRRRESEISSTGVAAFITTQRTVRKLYVNREVGPLPQGALPNLQELNAPIELVKQLIPGRPVEAIDITSSQENGQDWCREEIAKSTAVVRKLFFKTAILDTAMVDQMVTILPSLERLSLLVPEDTLLKVVETLTSLKCLTHLHINLVRRKYKVCVDYIISAIATHLRNANSCFSFIKIIEDGPARWKNTVFVWNRVIGVFQDVESVPALWAFVT